MLIGGIAVGLWGEPRATLDVDLTLWVDESEFDSTVAILSTRFICRTAKPLEFSRQNRVLPILASNRVAVDLLFARWPIEKQAIDRAVHRQIAGPRFA